MYLGFSSERNDANMRLKQSLTVMVASEVPTHHLWTKSGFFTMKTSLKSVVQAKFHVILKL